MGENLLLQIKIPYRRVYCEANVSNAITCRAMHISILARSGLFLVEISITVCKIPVFTYTWAENNLETFCKRAFTNYVMKIAILTPSQAPPLLHQSVS